jgi:hypothetical protein
LRPVAASRESAAISIHQEQKKDKKMLSLSVLLCPFVSPSVISASHQQPLKLWALDLGFWMIRVVKELVNYTTVPPAVMCPGHIKCGFWKISPKVAKPSASGPPFENAEGVSGISPGLALAAP